MRPIFGGAIKNLWVAASGPRKVVDQEATWIQFCSPLRWRTRWCQFGCLARRTLHLSVWMSAGAHSQIYASLCVAFECAPRAGAILFIKRQQAASWMIDERVCTCRVPVAAPKSTARRAFFSTFFFSSEFRVLRVSRRGLISRFVGWMKNLRDAFHKAEREIEAPSSSSKCHEMCMWHFRTATTQMERVSVPIFWWLILFCLVCIQILWDT